MDAHTCVGQHRRKQMRTQSAVLRSLIFPGLFDTLYESCHWLAVYRINYLIISHNLLFEPLSPILFFYSSYLFRYESGRDYSAPAPTPSSQPDRTKNPSERAKKKRTCKGFTCVQSNSCYY